MFSQSLDATPSTQGIRPFLHKIHPHKITSKNRMSSHTNILVLQPFCVPQNCKYYQYCLLVRFSAINTSCRIHLCPCKAAAVHRCRILCSVFFVGASSRLELNHDLSIVQVMKLPQICLAQGSSATPKSSSTALAPSH